MALFASRSKRGCSGMSKLDRDRKSEEDHPKRAVGFAPKPVLPGECQEAFDQIFDDLVCLYDPVGRIEESLRGGDPEPRRASGTKPGDARESCAAELAFRQKAGRLPGYLFDRRARPGRVGAAHPSRGAPAIAETAVGLTGDVLDGRKVRAVGR